jgi:hypothetical protein
VVNTKLDAALIEILKVRIRRQVVHIRVAKRNDHPSGQLRHQLNLLPSMLLQKHDQYNLNQPAVAKYGDHVAAERVPEIQVLHNFLELFQKVLLLELLVPSPEVHRQSEWCNEINKQGD